MIAPSQTVSASFLIDLTAGLRMMDRAINTAQTSRLGSRVSNRVARNGARPALGDLHRAITSCVNCLTDMPRDMSGYAKRQRCLLALSDLLVLRVLHYKYEARRMVQDGIPRQIKVQ
jgi:hypothetical protein